MDRSWFPTVAGILDVLAGVPVLLISLALVFATGLLGFVSTGDVPIEWIQGLLLALAGFVFLCAALAILGGTFAIRRRSFAWTLTGAIAAAVCFPPLGVASIILTVMAERDLRARSGDAE